MNIRKADTSDSEFIFKCLKLLLDKDLYPYLKFEKYFNECLENPYTEFWIASVDDKQLGFITANKFSMPRYLGFGVDFEEVVILKEYQGKGYGRAFLLKLTEHYRANPMCRKVIIKSNDVNGSCRLYELVFGKTDFVVFQTFLNKI